ncbi:MAG TPA: ribokinase [Dongiaceae bacterium]|nr:ribokinase [Dongiaceae bacterium]
MARDLVCVMGIFVADLAFRTPRLPVWGETVLGSRFRTGPGGKGSNQAVAAARLGGRTAFISKLGRDAFGRMARELYAAEGIDASCVFETGEEATGGAAIIVDDKGENAIVVVAGAAEKLTPEDIDRAEGLLGRSAMFMTQLELPVPLVEHGLGLARRLGAATVLNPAPAAPLPDSLLAQVDYLTPNETEAEALTGLRIASIEDAAAAAELLLARGAGTVVLTLGARGALVRNRELLRHVPAVDAGPVVDTTGAGDAFNGGFAVALAEGRDLVAAGEFACAVAGLSVTRPGTAPSMPKRAEVDALMKRKAVA